MQLTRSVEFDRDTFEALERRAREHGKTVDEEVVALVRQGLAKASPGDLVERARAIAAMTPEGVEQTDSALLLREDRNR